MKDLRPAILLLLLFTVITGVLYPALVTGVARVTGEDPAIELVGQTFTTPEYFWSRPSAIAYDARTSSGTNLGPTNLQPAMSERLAALHAVDPDNHAPIPVDLVTASASGLDPHISPEAARYQVARVARVRGVADADVRALVERHVEGRTLGILGEPRVNVALLNRDLDALGHIAEQR